MPAWSRYSRCRVAWTREDLDRGLSDRQERLEIVGDYRAVPQFEVERGCDQLGWNLKQLLRKRDELLGGETAMPLIHGLSKREGDAGAHPDQCILLDAELGRNLVGSAESYAANITREPMRVFRD